jgi:hypothetical protein
MLDTKRREVVALLGAGGLLLAVKVRRARAQQPVGEIVRIGILAIEPWPPIDTFRQALNDLGYTEGKTFGSSTATRRATTSDFPSWRMTSSRST